MPQTVVSTMTTFNLECRIPLALVITVFYYMQVSAEEYPFSFVPVVKLVEYAPSAPDEPSIQKLANSSF